jgi:hypothetical protein
VLLLLFAWCPFPSGLTPEGGAWYTKYTSHFPESGGNIRLYRRFPLGIHLLVDERAYVKRFYPPDCILYEPRRAVGTLHAACGSRMPVPVAYYAPWRSQGDFVADADGLQRTDTVRVIDGRPVGTIVRFPIADIRRAAEAQPPLFPGWSLFARRDLEAVRPVVRDEPVDVHARGPMGTTALIDALREEGPFDVTDALLRAGADVNARDSLGTTALMMAVGRVWPDTALVRRLLRAGADPDIADRTGMTALLRAALSKQTAVFRILLEEGADPCRREEKGQTILDFVAGPFPELKGLAQAAFRRCKG